ncbi:MAG TPA: GNAT family N-acetyltransferase [Steroidobacteraceae bacterium]|nr:GNAT family N-acetyltransferase [Steroidobacteraceae bacterium]
MASQERVWVSYLELLEPPRAPGARAGPERIERERLSVEAYLALYVAVGAPLRWDRRLALDRASLAALLEGERLELYVLRAGGGEALGWCELDREADPPIELTHFGLIPSAQGRGLGPWLLAVSLQAVWRSGARRIWLHTDTWDHPAALGCYQRAGFRIYDRRYEPVQGL